MAFDRRHVIFLHMSKELLSTADGVSHDSVESARGIDASLKLLRLSILRLPRVDSTPLGSLPAFCVLGP
jgi:hypothetical protein